MGIYRQLAGSWKRRDRGNRDRKVHFKLQMFGKREFLSGGFGQRMRNGLRISLLANQALTPTCKSEPPCTCLIFLFILFRKDDVSFCSCREFSMEK